MSQKKRKWNAQPSFSALKCRMKKPKPIYFHECSVLVDISATEKLSIGKLLNGFFQKCEGMGKMVSMIHLCQPSENWSNFVLDACSGYLHFLYRLQYNFIGTSISTIY